MNRMHLAAAGAVVAVVVALAAPAHADSESDLDLDRVPDHCVDLAEGYGLSTLLDRGTRLTMRELETRWDSHGKTDRGRSTHEKLVRVYPACHDDGVIDGFWRVAYYRPTMRTLGAAYMNLTFAVG